MTNYKVISKVENYESESMNVNRALDLYDSLGGCSKSYSVVKSD